MSRVTNCQLLTRNCQLPDLQWQDHLPIAAADDDLQPAALFLGFLKDCGQLFDRAERDSRGSFQHIAHFEAHVGGGAAVLDAGDDQAEYILRYDVLSDRWDLTMFKQER